MDSVYPELSFLFDAWTIDGRKDLMIPADCAALCGVLRRCDYEEKTFHRSTRNAFAIRMWSKAHVRCQHQ